MKSICRAKSNYDTIMKHLEINNQLNIYFNINFNLSPCLISPPHAHLNPPPPITPHPTPPRRVCYYNQTSRGCASCQPITHQSKRARAVNISLKPYEIWSVYVSAARYFHTCNDRVISLANVYERVQYLGGRVKTLHKQK